MILDFIALVFYLLACHALADYTLQTDTMARSKNSNTPMSGVPWPYWMGAHALIHGLLVALVIVSYAGSRMHGWAVATYLGLTETVLHWNIDVAKCQGKTNIHQDQALHLACKLTWAAFAIAYWKF